MRGGDTEFPIQEGYRGCCRLERLGRKKSNLCPWDILRRGMEEDGGREKRLESAVRYVLGGLTARDGNAEVAGMARWLTGLQLKCE